MSNLMDPIILEPVGMTAEAGWDECHDYVEKCGGLTHRCGSPNWRAAFGADPGVCSCPACHQMYWAWGTRHRCAKCGFEYPTDWWPMYSYGVNEAKRRGTTGMQRLRDAGLDVLHQQRLAHPYYRYGFEHPIDDAWREHNRIDWRASMKGER